MADTAAPGQDTPAETELRHGYTLSDINQLAKTAVWRDVWHQSLPLPERQDIAWSAIAEHLYASDHKPAPGELVRAAWNALRAETEANWHTHGIGRTISVFDGEQTMQGFNRYWHAFGRNTPGRKNASSSAPPSPRSGTPSPEKHQVLITALANADDYGQAAEALGRPRQSYVSMLATARKAFRELWHEGETPSRHWGTDRRRNPDAQHNKTHPGRSAATEAIRQRKRRRRTG